MQSESNAIQNDPVSHSDCNLTFLIETEPWLRVFSRNVGDMFRNSPPQPWITSAPGEYWADALVHRPVAWAALRQSCLGHILAVLAIYGLTLLWVNQPYVLPEQLPRTHPVANYQLSEYLPPVAKVETKPEPPKRRVAQKADPEYAPQEIISVHVGHNSTQQTIVNPVSPRLLSQDTPLPNVVAWTQIPVAPVAANHRLNRPLPMEMPPVVPPVEQPVQRKLNALEFPVQPVVAPAEAPVSRNMARLDLPVEAQAAVPPVAAPAQRKLGDMNLAFNAPIVDAPKLPAPEQQANAGNEKAAQPPAAATPVPPPPPPPPPVASGAGKAEAQELGQLLALNVHPVAPAGAMTVPEGNRQGEFAVGPNGRVGASARPEIAAGETDSAGGSKGGSSLPGNVYIAPPPEKITANVVVSAPAPRAEPPGLPLSPSAHGRFTGDLPGSGRFENQVFGGRKYYSMALNMPNLTSAGSSWVIRFAEMNPAPGSSGDGVSAPEPLRKVDPAYPATLMRDRIEGVVILYAVIRSDGTVGEVRVLQGIQDVLDENAREAMEKWHFRPGTKNGAPVDLEAVIKIPFRAPKAF
jgi:TonB family protein